MSTTLWRSHNDRYRIQTHGNGQGSKYRTRLSLQDRFGEPLEIVDPGQARSMARVMLQWADRVERIERQERMLRRANE